jgi:hypothetical protein
MKTLFKFILVVMAMTLIWNVMSGPEIHIHGIDDIDAMEFSGAGLIVVGVVVFGLIVAAIALFSAIWVAIIVVTCVVASILFAGLAMIWPFVLFGLICYWIFKDNNKAVMQN